MTLREEFVLEALEPDSNITALCRKYGISRKTGYKWLKRFRENGKAGLVDRSRRPHDSPLRLSGELVLQILELRRDHPRWGPKKLRVLLARQNPGIELPCVRTVGRVLQRAGLSRPRRRDSRKHVCDAAPNPPVDQSNDLWTVDLKGYWLARNGEKIEPLTVRDAFSRFVLCTQLLRRNTADQVRAEFERLFRRHGLPRAILVDNGRPFVSTRARAGLTRLSAWWVSLGVQLIRTRPGRPQDNGGHERMHLDVRFDVEDAEVVSREDGQRRLDLWRHEFNHVRPHEALGGLVPAAVYSPSGRRFRGPLQPTCPEGYQERTLTKKGFLRFRGKEIYVSESLANRPVALRPIDDRHVHLCFYDVDLGMLQLTP